jgi:hypothetical protein
MAYVALLIIALWFAAVFSPKYGFGLGLLAMSSTIIFISIFPWYGGL